MNDLPVVILGQMGSGKDTLARRLIAEYGYTRNVTNTSRPMRPGEVDGVDYHFRTEEWFHENWDELAEVAKYTASFGDCYYGSMKSSFVPGSVTILTPEGLRTIRRRGVKCIAAYIQAPEETLRERALRRGDDPVEVNRRIYADKLRFQELDNIDIYLDGTKTKDEVVSEFIRKMTALT